MALAAIDSIPGWLLPAEAEKLYELATETTGPVLEIGTHRGKSTILIALALQAEGDAARVVYTLDVDREAQSAAMASAQAHGVAGRIVFVHGTITAFSRAYPHVRPMLTFVDGDHRRAGVTRDLNELEALVPTGGTLLFHDFHDPRNHDPENTEVKVHPAVMASWVARGCHFEGVFGSCGVFTRRSSPPPRVTATRADLLKLDTLHNRYLYRLRYPAGRLWRRLRRRSRRISS